MKLSGLFSNISTFSILFFIVGVIDLLGVAYCPLLRWVSKPLIMILLMAYYYYNSKRESSFQKLFFVGLIAALFGDVFLLFGGELYFLLGLSSFLIMQVLYTVTFLKDSFRPSFSKWLITALLFAIFGYYIYHLWPHLGSMDIPVFIYSLVIVLMSLSALMRNKDQKGYEWVFIGALLFMVSDGFIAWNKFISPVVFGGIIVMSTYIVAQYFIVVGMLKKSL